MGSSRSIQRNDARATRNQTHMYRARVQGEEMGGERRHITLGTPGRRPSPTSRRQWRGRGRGGEGVSSGRRREKVLRAHKLVHTATHICIGSLCIVVRGLLLVGPGWHREYYCYYFFFLKGYYCYYSSITE